MFHPYLKNCKYTSSKSKCIHLQQLDTLSEKIWLEKIVVTKPNSRQFPSTKNFLEVCKYNSNIELVIVSHNLTNKFQPLDISANQSAKKFISNKFNWWYADRVRSQLPNGMAPGDLVM